MTSLSSPLVAAFVYLNREPRHGIIAVQVTGEAQVGSEEKMEAHEERDAAWVC